MLRNATHSFGLTGATKHSNGLPQKSGNFWPK
jgi:hypothetical protein